jgi:hypothetical protein
MAGVSRPAVRVAASALNVLVVRLDSVGAGHSDSFGTGGDTGVPGDPHGAEPDPRLLSITVAGTLAAAREVLAVFTPRSAGYCEPLCWPT